ncbi:class I SAM-dependent methyltransferase [Candidatus Woesearchaeota archaeon]|nr:class I SAM-dependent methyltransferase [Candidatus Woesearchaeota archaeon]
MDYSEYVRSQVSAEQWKIVEGTGINLDSKVCSALWPGYVNLEKRSEKEVPFLLDQLSEYANPRVLDAALGSGATTISLKLAGIEDVISNDLDEDFITVAIEEAGKRGVNLDTFSYDWRELDKSSLGKFDAILCLGNSLTYLFKHDDLIKSLRNFRGLLKPEGKLIIDERNYRQTLEGKFKNTGEIVYCGKQEAEVKPIYIKESMMIFEFGGKGQKGYFVANPFLIEPMHALLKESGFNEITAYGDYKADFRPEEPEFITYVCKESR